MPQKILLIRLRLIGDVVLTTPAIRAIRRAHPDAHLAYLVEPHAAAVVAHNPHLDEVIVAPLLAGTRRWRADAALAWRLRRTGYDAVLDFHGGPRSSLFTWASRAPRRIGYDVSGRGWMYSERVDRPRGHRPRHSVINQWDLVSRFDAAIPVPSPDSDPVEMPETPADTGAVAARLAALGGDPHAPLVVVHVGAGNEFRRWPEPAFGRLLEALHADSPVRRIILTTGAAQAPTADAIRRLAVAGGVPGRSIGGDSGPAHVAATTQVPMVVLFGPTTPAVWGAWRPSALATETVDAGELPCRPCHQRHCEPGDFRCLRTVTPDMVMAAARRALAREAARRSTR